MAVRILTAFSLVVAVAAEARPHDWISHFVPMKDSRHENEALPENCRLEIIELPYAKDAPEKRGAVLLIPGLFQNAEIFDLLPEKGISFARYLMREKGLQVYFLHVRGIGRSCYPHHSSLDRHAAHDIPAALDFVARREDGYPLFAIGHSQGGMTLLGALSGLVACGNRKALCFHPRVASKRQDRLAGALILASNYALSTHGRNRKSGRLGRAALLDLVVHPFSPAFDRVPATLFGLWGYFSSGNSFWDFVYNPHNVTPEARRALFRRTLDSSTTPILHQFAEAVKTHDLLTEGGLSYSEALANVKLPVAIVTFEHDVFAEPVATRDDTFTKIGSEEKSFRMVPGEGHLDFAMDPARHAATAAPLDDWLP